MFTKSSLYLALFFCSVSLYAQQNQNDTKNITPFSTQVVKHEKIAASKTGEVFVLTSIENNKEKKYEFYNNTGNYWRNITPVPGWQISDVKDIITTADSAIYVLSKANGTFANHTVMYWGRAYGNWYNYDAHRLSDVQAITLDKRNNELLVAGKGSYASNFYLARYHDGKWQEIIQKKISPEIKTILDTYKIEKIVTDQKNNIYTYLSNAAENKYLLLAWTGKEWKMVGDALRGAVYDMVTDQQNNLYVAGNFKDDNNAYYILKWDGKKMSNVPAPSEEKFTADINRTLAIGNNNQLIAAGRHKKGKENIILTWNGSDWEQYGVVPGFVSDIQFANGKIYANVEGRDAGIYLVPENGKLTASSTEAPGPKADDKAKEVLALYNEFQTNFPGILTKLPALYKDWQSQITRTGSVAKSKEIERESWNILGYIYTFSSRLEALKLITGDNTFYDPFKRAVRAQMDDYETLKRLMVDYQNQFQDKPQFDKWWTGYIAGQKNTQKLFKKLDQDIPMYKKKNSL